MCLSSARKTLTCRLCFVHKDELSGLKQFLAREHALKMMKNAFSLPYKLFSFSR